MIFELVRLVGRHDLYHSETYQSRRPCSLLVHFSLLAAADFTLSFPSFLPYAHPREHGIIVLRSQSSSGRRRQPAICHPP